MNRMRTLRLQRPPFWHVVAQAPIHAYRRWISPYTPPTCRFFPTCSEYALQAIARYGPWKGWLLASWRIMRCHPFHPGGYDPVKDPPFIQRPPTSFDEES